MAALNTYKARVRRAWLGVMLTIASTVSTVLFLTFFTKGSHVRFYISVTFIVIAFLLVWRLLSGRKNRPIPVLNYHSVTSNAEWLVIGDSLSITPGEFERHLRYLSRHNYRSLTISELYADWDGIHHTKQNRRSVALTFDDGYLDNWAFVFPLLQRYRIKATIFISTDFVASEPQQPAEGSPGYLCWQQIKEMTRSGLVEVQPHGCTHSRVFCSTRLIDYHHPGFQNIWLFWNHFPDRKKNWWQHDLSTFAAWGTPLFEQGPALTHKKFIPDQSIVEALQRFSAQRQSSDYCRSNWRAEFEACYREQLARLGGKAGSFESDAEFGERVAAELRLSKERIENETGAKADFFCWPENQFSEESLQLAKKCGYNATASNYHTGVNGHGDDRSVIRRVFIGNRFFGVKNRNLDFIGFLASVRCFEGDYLWYPLIALGAVLKKLFNHNLSNSESFTSLGIKGHGIGTI
jgi:peptidoglycan/xylan/chitin deacetylase (PgdA/CDA1 family)